jgi:hypothetical protein
MVGNGGGTRVAVDPVAADTDDVTGEGAVDGAADGDRGRDVDTARAGGGLLPHGDVSPTVGAPNASGLAPTVAEPNTTDANACGSCDEDSVA